MCYHPLRALKRCFLDGSQSSLAVCTVLAERTFRNCVRSSEGCLRVSDAKSAANDSSGIENPWPASGKAVGQDSRPRPTSSPQKFWPRSCATCRSLGGFDLPSSVSARGSSLTPKILSGALGSTKRFRSPVRCPYRF